MAQRPRTIGIYFCNRISVDSTNGEMSLVGVFSGMTFNRFPSPIQRFTIYAMLYDGVGEGVVEVRILQAETEQDIYRHQHWTRFPGHGLLSQLEVKVKRCQFPRPGNYTVEIRFDGDLIDSRILPVFGA